MLKTNSLFFSDNRLFLFILPLTPFVYLENLFDSVDLPRFAFVSVISSIWLLAWLTKSNKKIFNWNPLFALILTLLFFAATSAFWGTQNTLYQSELYFYSSLVILIFLFTQVSANSIYLFSATLCVTAAIIATIGILQNFNINPLNYKQVAPPASTFINKNFAANYFDLVLPVSLTLFFISTNKKEAWIYSISITLIISYIILTRARGAYLAAIITFTMFLISIHLFPLLKKQIKFISQQYKKQIMLIIFIPIILFFLPNQQYQSDYEENRYSALFSKQQQNSISVRLNAYQNSLDLYKENPIFGVGLGGFQSHFRPYMQSVLAKNKIFSDFIYLHNEPLQLLVELGIIGFIIVFVFFILLFRSVFLLLYNGLKLNTAPTFNKQKILYLGFFIALLASLFHSLFSFPLHQPTSATFLAIYIGVLLNLGSKKVFIYQSNIPKILFYSKISLTILFLGLVANFYFNYMQSSYYMKEAALAFEINNCEKAASNAILSNNIYGADYLSQTQGLNIFTSCPLTVNEKLTFADNILKYNPTHPKALFLAGMSYYKLKNYELSSKIMKSLSFLYPYFTGSYTFLGHIALKEKQYHKAKQLYTHALDLAPQNKAAKYYFELLIKKGY